MSLDMISRCVRAKLLAKLEIMAGQLKGFMNWRNRKKRHLLSHWVTFCLALPMLAAPALAKPFIVSGSAYVIDGDTLVIGRRHIRLYGVDAFERDQTCGRYPCGHEARNALLALINSQPVSCAKQDMDPYGRIVAVCKSSAGLDLGGEMVRRGLAVAYRRFSMRYINDEAYAKSNHLGAWAHGFESPLNYRRHSR